MKTSKLGLIVFYLITLILTVVFALGQQKLGISYDKITLPQLAPAFAVGVTILLFGSCKVSLNFNLDKTLIVKVIISVFLPILLFCISYFIYLNISQKPSFTGDWQQSLLLGLTGMLIGAIGEEIGWRGFLQVNLEKIYSVLISSIITGLLWGAWHIGNYKNGSLFMICFLLFTVSTSIILRKLLTNTNNSFLISVLFHFSINLSFVLFFKNALTDPKMIFTIGLIFTIVAIGFLNFRPSTLKS
jgi:uncharacterized protein